MEKTLPSIKELSQISSKPGGGDHPPLSQQLYSADGAYPSAEIVGVCLVSIATCCPGFVRTKAFLQRKRETPVQHMSAQPAMKSAVPFEKVANTSLFTHSDPAMDCTPIGEVVG